MVKDIVPNSTFSPPDAPLLRRTFLILWAVDMITAVLLILVPYASELNPITVYFFTLFGIPGVVFVACCYAAIFIIIGEFLPHPIDIAFVVVLVALYVFFVFNNVVILVFDWSLFDYFD